MGYNINEYLKGVHVRFLPEDTDDEKITSRAMAEKVNFQQRLIFDMNGVPKRVKDGELVNYGDDDDDEEPEP